jgi:DNA mismatch endonuclease (patch repair protein)
MAAIKATNTVPEKLIRKLLTAEGYRYRLHCKNLPGSPDIVLSKYKTVIFIHGCFWHRHPCHFGSSPKSNCEYWDKKFKSNIERDKKIIQSLSSSGWKVIIVWECAIKGKLRLTEHELQLKLSSIIQNEASGINEIEGCIQITT